MQFNNSNLSRNKPWFFLFGPKEPILLNQISYWNIKVDFEYIFGLVYLGLLWLLEQMVCLCQDWFRLLWIWLQVLLSINLIDCFTYFIYYLINDRNTLRYRLGSHLGFSKTLKNIQFLIWLHFSRNQNLKF